MEELETIVIDTETERLNFIINVEIEDFDEEEYDMEYGNDDGLEQETVVIPREINNVENTNEEFGLAWEIVKWVGIVVFALTFGMFYVIFKVALGSDHK